MMDPVRNPCSPGAGNRPPVLVVPSIGEFWATKSLEELAEAQRVGVVESIETLRDNTISEEEADALIAALEL